MLNFNDNNVFHILFFQFSNAQGIPRDTPLHHPPQNQKIPSRYWEKEERWAESWIL